jgi:WD40 repeat protein
VTESAPGATPFGGHSGPVFSVAFHGTQLASGGADGSIWIWDPRTGEQLHHLTGHTGRVFSLAFTPDGTQLASGGADGSIWIWDPRTGEQLHHLTGHTGPVLSVAFTSDGTQLASGGADGTIRIWNPRNGMQVDGTGFRVSRRVGRPLAGVRSDSPSGEDGLGVSADVETLADLIAAMDTRPPLAIALIGDWGAGKSSVMLQVQRRVDVLAEMSRNNPGLSVFASSVRQVRFNAWHYSDEHVWAGLVTELFRTLAVDHEDAEDTTDASQRHNAVVDRDRLRSELAQRETEQRRLSAALDD